MGQMKKGYRDGTGTLRERNGVILYEGDWKDDKPHGYGKKYFPRTHDRHEGSYVHGERHGLGIYLWANGDKYSGDWDKGLMHGRGRFEWAANGEVYNGQWVKGKMTGEGIKVQSDGCRLQGAFVAGELHGWAEKIFSGGDRYTGYFKNNSREGYGEYVWTDGSRYRGQWHNDLTHGRGELVTALDRISAERDRDRLRYRRGDSSWLDSILSYSGEFSCGRLHGFGTANMFDGSIYTGEWKEDRFEGWGRLRHADQSEYEGDLHYGMRHGQGQLQHHMQFIPTLEEEDNMTDGSVTSTSTPPHPFFPGHVALQIPAPLPLTHIPHEAEFEPPQEELDLTPQGPAVLVEDVLHTWGGIYIGEWVQDRPHGRGTLQLRNGQLYQGNFYHGRIHHQPSVDDDISTGEEPS